ncbi:hypothetical protein SAMN03080617_02518 [Algoriphagus alkaliphilus]|uniref:Uncharacterized protein n=1 Tax=Algoriphagus alkaliphilus TaxID=279824 RepID=A0A1G5YG80_9BACT|nr:hypothetical protein [Algoriphagus alkaliphilus]SDA81400.1 hypothetical protein SAMN03080617_02518 [Algoriphagus alkaliphilus]
MLFSDRCIRSGIRIPSAGVMVMRVRSKDEIKIDFGPDACDRIVTITRGGEAKTVTLPIRL